MTRGRLLNGACSRLADRLALPIDPALRIGSGDDLAYARRSTSP